MTPLVQMEEAERQFNRAQVAEGRERQQVEDNRREPENVAPEFETEATEEPTGLDTVPPIPLDPNLSKRAD